MIVFELNKLVRDKVYDSMVEMGQELKSEVLEGKARERALLDKFSEELQELLDGDDKDPVDLGSVLMAYAYSQGYTQESFLAAIKERDGRRGAFDYGRYIHTVSLRPGDPWVDYYRKDPERFKEVSKDAE